MDIQQYITSGIIESYVMGLCSPDEEEQLEQLRNQYPAINAAIVSYEEEMEYTMLLQSTLPDDETDQKILTQLSTLNKPTPVIKMHPAKFNWFKAVAAVAIILLLLSAGLNIYLFQQNNNNKSIADNSLPLNDYKILNSPTITPVAMYGVGLHAICRCTMFWDKKTGKLYVMIHHLIPSTELSNYQLWASVNNELVSVGIVNDKIRGRFIEIENVPPKATEFIVTLEKAGGNTTPTMNQTYLKGQI